MRDNTGRGGALASLRIELCGVIEQLQKVRGSREMEIEIAIRHLEHALAELDAAQANERNPRWQ